MASPIDMRMVAARPKPHVGHRFTIVSFSHNLANISLRQSTATISFDVLGLRLLEHDVARDASIRSRGVRIDRWLLDAIRPGSYVVLTSMEAMLGGLLVTGAAPAVVVTVRHPGASGSMSRAPLCFSDIVGRGPGSRCPVALWRG